MKSAFFLSIFFLFATFAGEGHAQSIAWFNPTKVLQESRPGKAVMAKQQALQKKFAYKRKQLEAPLAKEKDDIEKEWKSFQANMSVLNAKARKKRMEQLKTKYDTWMTKVRKLQGKLSKLQQDLAGEFQKVAEPFSNKLKAAAAKVATNNSYAFILAHDPKNPTLLLYAKASLDVTDKLINILGR
ncbi:OmpH family outer membrane protein [Myxococcota bacterium]|nr:OmpH family outer membrane protein [Myxococcota bacterium]MBU1536539.1 OmpH family outer membrane protein [Myxococcota bacterium]